MRSLLLNFTACSIAVTSRLRLDEEVREIDALLQRAKKRELFNLKQRWAVRIQDVYQSLLDFRPQIVHFSGHGAGEDGLVLEDETSNLRLVETAALAGLFEVFADTIECVVLNACYSELQASAIATYIPYVIGMKQAIGDEAAIKFATGFYSALSSGESVEFAYKLACTVIQLDGIAQENLLLAQLASTEAVVWSGASHFRKFVVRASCSLVVHVSKMLTLLIVFLQNWDAPGLVSLRGI